MMRKRTIGLLYLLGVLLDLWGISVFLILVKGLSMGDNFSSLAFFGPDVVQSFNGIDVTIYSIQVLLIIELSIMFLAGTVLSLTTWIIVLIRHAKAQHWGWFTLTFFFSGILLLIYVLSDLPAAGQQPGSAPWPAPSSDLQASPASRRRRQLFRYGLVAGGIIAGLNILLVTFIIPGITPRLWVALYDAAPGSFTFDLAYLNIGVPGVSLLIMHDTIPLLLILAVFFWMGWVASRRIGQTSTGVDVALRAFLWLLLTLPLLIGADILTSLSPGTGLYTLSIIFLLDFNRAILFALLACGIGLPLAAWGARIGTRAKKAFPASHQPFQTGSYPPAQPGAAPSSGSPTAIAARTVPTAFPGAQAQQRTSSPSLPPAGPTPSPDAGGAQPPHQFSALDLLQQRYARGEIDSATYQQMRALLEK